MFLLLKIYENGSMKKKNRHRAIKCSMAVLCEEQN
jgi:hypothetical protein